MSWVNGIHSPLLAMDEFSANYKSCVHQNTNGDNR